VHLCRREKQCRERFVRGRGSIVNVILAVETLLAFVLAVTIHEAAHAGMAALLGDSTPVSEGRFSLSPRRQMSAIGSIVAIVSSFALFPVGLGWGRPVSVDARRLRPGPNAGLILVSLAGPVANLVLGLGIALTLAVLPGYHALGAVAPHCDLGFPPFGVSGEGAQTCLSAAQPAYLLRIDQLAFTFAVSNIVLALINIIPLHPLDGYKILYALLPNRQAIRYRDWEPYMELLLLALFFAVPVVLGYLGIGFSPLLLFQNWAVSIAGGFASNIANFYFVL
jgi:Zn-dependent protease